MSRIRRFVRDSGLASSTTAGSGLGSPVHALEAGRPPVRVVDVEVMCAARARVVVEGQPQPASRRLSYAAWCLVAVDLAQKIFAHLAEARRLPALITLFVIPFLVTQANMLPRAASEVDASATAPRSPSAANTVMAASGADRRAIPAPTTPRHAREQHDRVMSPEQSSWPRQTRASDRTPTVVYHHHRGYIVRK